MRRLVIVVLSFTYFSSFGQNPVSGEMFFSAEWEKNIDSSLHYLEHNNIAKAIAWSEKAIRVSENKDLLAHLTSRLVKAKILIEEGNYSACEKEAVFVLEKIGQKEIPKSEEGDLELRSWHILGLVNKERKNMQKAKYYFELCTESWRRYKDRANTGIELGNILIAEDLYHLAIKHFREVVENSGDPVILAKAYVGLCDAYSGLKIEDISVRNCQKAIGIYKDIEENTLLFEAYNTLGSAFSKSGKLDSALFYHRKALQASIINENDKGTFFAARNLVADFYILQQNDSLVKYTNYVLDLIGSKDLAEEVKLKALLCRHFVDNNEVVKAAQIFSTLPDIDDYWKLLSKKEKITFIENLNKYYMMVGENSTAIEGYEMLIALKDSLMNEILGINILTQRELINSKPEGTTEELFSKSEQKNLSGFERENSKSIFVSPVLYILVLLIVIPAIFYYYREKRWKQISRKEAERNVEREKKYKKLEEKVNDPKYQFAEGFLALSNGKQLNYSEIIVLKTSQKNKGKVEIQTVEGETIEETGTIKDFASSLKSPLFVNTHQSFIVNIFHIKETPIGRTEVLLINGTRANVARSHKKELFDIIDKYRVKPTK